MSLVLTLRSSRTGSLVPGSIRTRVLAWMGKGIHARARTVVLKQLKLYRMFLDLGSAGAFGMPEEGGVSGGDKEVVFVRRAGHLSTSRQRRLRQAMNVFVASSKVARVAENVERTVGLAEPRCWPEACLEEFAGGRFRPPTWLF